MGCGEAACGACVTDEIGCNGLLCCVAFGCGCGCADWVGGLDPDVDVFCGVVDGCGCVSVVESGVGLSVTGRSVCWLFFAD